MNKTKVVLGIVLLLLICGLLYLNFNKKENSSVVDDAKEVVSIQKEVVNKKEVINNTENIIKTYRSEKLGVEFEYPNIDPFLKDMNPTYNKENFVVEKDNRISIPVGGGNVFVFKKDPQITFENTIRGIFPNCKVVISKNTNTRSYNLNMDMMAIIYFKDSHSVEQENVISKQDFMVGSNGDVVQSKDNLKCLEEVSKFGHNGYIYITDSDLADKFIAIDGLAQEPEGVLRRDGDKIVTWMSTVRFVK